MVNHCVLAYEAKNYFFHVRTLYTLNCVNILTVLVRNLNILWLLRQNCIINQCDAANILHKIYDKNSITECELIAYALDNIVYAALYEK